MTLELKGKDGGSPRWNAHRQGDPGLAEVLIILAWGGKKKKSIQKLLVHVMVNP